MKQYKLWNNIFGWLAFAVAAFTYFSTMEPTASFWDCPEFIACGYKLEVGHPPGAPFFMLIQKFFSLFAGNDVSQIAYWVNAWSAVASAFTILFLFWTITRLARKIVKPDVNGEYRLAQTIAIIGSGLVGALLYTFSDSFWYSAVEAEVYASSAVFTAVVLWAILKWEDEADSPYGNRWLILIAYLMGISIGVHLLNLLTIPVLVLVYYLKKYEVTKKGIAIAAAVSLIILGLVTFALAPGYLTVASWFELLFVNSFGMSFNSGFLAHALVVVAVLAWALYESYAEKSPLRIKISFIAAIVLSGIAFLGESIVAGVLVIVALSIFFYLKTVRAQVLNTIMLFLTVILIGASSYAIIIIRSNANTPLDENSPGTVFALKSYLSREQYGKNPLFYGPYFDAEVKRNIEGDHCVAAIDNQGDIWSKQEKENSGDKDKYVVTGKKQDYIYDDAFCTVFPRMYSNQGSHVSAYKDWSGFVGKQIQWNACGRMETRTVPTFSENLKFFFSYQVAYMYFRYFGWNFIGRQNDMQGYGEVDKGSVITGFKFIDNITSGNQDTLPPDQAENKGRNVYYLLPFLLGILGIIYQLRNGKEGKEVFWLTGILFFMTGLAIIVYLNQTPYQPRERDYAYGGSFYAFAIWIGMAVLWLTALLEKILKNKTISATIATLVCLLVPVQMASQNWDDHNRSLRYTCRDFGYNYLMSLAPNAIIFTNGDNDTFPLWYLQEVEGVRPDVRVCNLSYLQTDWYIDQMRREYYESKPLPISWKRYQYAQGTRDVAYVHPLAQFPSMDAKTAIQDYVLNPDLLNDGVAIFPTNKLTIPVNKDSILAMGIVKPEEADKILPEFTINLRNRLLKHELMIVEMLSQNNWKRPIYFAATVGDDYYMGMKDNFRLEGVAYRIVPVGEQGSGEKIDTELMYDNMVNKFRWGGDKNGGALRPDIYLDETNLRMCHTFRLMFNKLVDGLIAEGKRDKALKALDCCMTNLPISVVKADYTTSFLAAQYYELGQTAKGDVIMNAIADNCVKNIAWYAALTNPMMRASVSQDLYRELAILQSVLAQCNIAKRDELMSKYRPIFEKYSQAIQ
ncbi:MAG: DUF2723 domain-containing protein [Prevotellaceae bacterium]|jgi:MFS family permease|nr:DUF2723 domain-containing protein [Prevotellaceae bacterium]